jgi:hypothetical protein
MNDALEILNELEDIISQHQVSSFDRLVLIEEYVAQKKTEFEPATGDCCG